MKQLSLLHTGYQSLYRAYLHHTGKDPEDVKNHEYIIWINRVAKAYHEARGLRSTQPIEDKQDYERFVWQRGGEH